MEKSEFLVCERCGKDFEIGREEYMDPKKHGWPVPTGRKNEDGVDLWELRLCANATEEEIAAYKKARAAAASQEQGIVARGFPEDGEGDGGGE